MDDINEPSPFQAMDSEKNVQFSRERSKIEKMRSFIIGNIRSLFLHLLPSDEIKQMPPMYMYGFGTILIVCLLGIFLALFIDGFITARNQSFLAPLVDLNNPDPNCESIQLSNTGQYLATPSGVWEGQDGFIYSEATFEATVTNFDMSSDEFTSVMVELYTILQQVGNVTSNSDLGTNLLYWMSFTAEPEEKNAAQRFYLIGDPMVIFDRQQVIGYVSSVNGTCNATSMSQFDLSRAYLETSFQYDEFIGNEFCNQTIDPTFLGFVNGVNNNEFEFSVDIRSIITCLSVNMDILFFNQLIPISAFGSTFDYNGVQFETASYYNPKFPGMSSLLCLNSETVQQCIIRVSPYLYALPVFFHLGNSTEVPQPCVCSKLSQTQKDNSFNLCNRFNFLVGFLFYDNPSPDYFIELGRKFNDNFTLLNEAAFNASFMGSYWGNTSPQRATFESPEQRQAAFEFCKVNGSYCKLMVFSLFDLEQYNWAISNNYYQLMFGACQDRISVPWSNWSRLIETPFAPLVQSYQKCRNSASSVAINQIGIQIGNLSVLTPFCVLFILGLVYVYQRAAKVDIPMAYTKQEKESALEALAISLLLARDRRAAVLQQQKRDQKKKNKGNSALQKLLQEHNASKKADAGGVSMSSLSKHSFSDMNQSIGLMSPESTSSMPSLGANGFHQQVLWAMIEALENDAPLHHDLYRLKSEVTQQQRKARPRQKLISWKGVKTSAKQKLRCRNKTPGATTAGYVQDNSINGSVDGEEVESIDDEESEYDGQSLEGTQVSPSETGLLRSLRQWLQFSTSSAATNAGHHTSSVDDSTSYEMQQNPMQSSSILDTDVEMADHTPEPDRSQSPTAEKNRTRSVAAVSMSSTSYVMSDSTAILLQNKALTILNHSSAASAASAAAAATASFTDKQYLSEAEMAVAIEMLVKRFEAVARAMETSSQVDVEQQYWSLLREVNSVVCELRLSESALFLLDIKAIASSTTSRDEKPEGTDSQQPRRSRLRTKEKAQLRSLVWPLGRLLAVHGLCTSNVSMSQLEAVLGESEVERSETQRRYVSVWAYRLRGEVVVTLAELLHLREQLAEDSDDDDDDDNNNNNDAAV